VATSISVALATLDIRVAILPPGSASALNVAISIFFVIAGVSGMICGLYSAVSSATVLTDSHASRPVMMRLSAYGLAYCGAGTILTSVSLWPFADAAIIVAFVASIMFIFVFRRDIWRRGRVVGRLIAGIYQMQRTS